jgi:hypothetical protein
VRRRGQQQLAKAAHKVKDKASAVSPAGPVETATETATDDTSTSPVSVNGVPAAPSTVSPGVPDELR